MKRNFLEPNWLIIIVFFASGIFFGALGTYLWLNANSVFYGGYKLHPADKKYQFINPLLAVEFSERNSLAINKPLELSLNGFIKQAKESGEVVDVSVYYRDIESGAWVGINENETFSPGKLLKVPLMISIFKLAETEPSILDQEIIFKGPHLEQEFFKPPESLEIGKNYSARGLIQRMIVDSNDDAANALFDFVDKRALNEVYSDLGVSFQETSKYTDDFISTKNDTLFFRVLYNATYISREYSEEALKYLVDAPSIVGIGENIPKSVATADAFGARRLIRNGTPLIEMNDCGIIYYPAHPYILCVFERGKDIAALERSMGNLSSIIYQDVDYRYKNL